MDPAFAALPFFPSFLATPFVILPVACDLHVVVDDGELWRALVFSSGSDEKLRRRLSAIV